MSDREAVVTIDGQTLTEAQSMATRVALCVFLDRLQNPKHAKELGEVLAAGYKARVTEVLALMGLGR